MPGLFGVDAMRHRFQRMNAPGHPAAEGTETNGKNAYKVGFGEREHAAQIKRLSNDFYSM